MSKKKQAYTEIPFGDIDPTDRNLWVLNKTREPYHGDVFFVVPKQRGNGTDDVRVVRSWLPQNLIGQAAVSQLLESSEFRRQVVTLKNLVVISAEDAQDIMDRKGASMTRDEETRVHNRLRNNIDDVLGASGNDNPVSAYDSVSRGKDQDAASNEPNIKVQMLLQPLEEGEDINENEVINSLTTLSENEELSRMDLRHILKLAKKGGRRQLVRFANAELKEMNRQAALDDGLDPDDDD